MWNPLKKFIHQPLKVEPTTPLPSEPAADLLLGLYEVKGDPIPGGMGKVFRVHHTTWNVDLAMKQPHAKLFQTEEQKQKFIHECDAWINLGLHPHIVSCHYVREIDGVPSIFAEWMDGGSLTRWITDGKLESLEKILDVAIQFAWGLDYAHEQKLIHQDVKPDNVLLTSERGVKIADFGIANAKAGLGLSTSRSSQLKGTMVSDGGMYTPEYASPEQITGKQLTRRCDVFSWAVSMVEMCIGGRQWRGSSAAVQVEFDFYMENTVVPVPHLLKELLRECMRKNEAERPHDFKIIADKLLEIFRAEMGKAYERVVPNAAADAPDSLNNRALSYIDMGQPEQAEQKWDRALNIDPAHLESTYNQGIYLWRSGKIDDLELIRRLEAVHHGSWWSEYLLAMIHLGRCDAESAEPLLESAASRSNNDSIVIRAMAITANQRGKGKCLRTFEGHTSHVTSVSLSPDGKCALSGSEDNTLKLWDMETGRCLRTFKGHMHPVASVSFSPDGKCALSGSKDDFPSGTYDDILKLWDVESGQCLRTFEGHTSHVTSVSFSPDGKFALSGSSDETLKLWDMESGQCLRTFKGHMHVVTSVSFSPDGKSALSGSYDNTLKLWDVESGQCLRTFEGHTREHSGHLLAPSPVYSVCFSPDGKSALSGSNDRTMKLWDVASGQCLRTFKGHTSEVSSVSFSPDGKSALSGSWDRTLKLWDVVSGQCLRTFEGHRGSVSSVRFSPDGKSALSGNYDNKLWDVPVFPAYADWALCRIRTVQQMLDHEQRFSAALQEAAKKTDEGNITAALAAMTDARSVPGFERAPQCLGLNVIISRHCRAMRLQDAWLERTFEGHARSVSSVCFSPDGKSALSGSWDKTLKLWDVESGQCLRTFEGLPEWVNSVSLSVDGRWALSGSDDKTLRLWEVATGRFLYTFKGHAGDVRSVSFSPDGKSALSGSEDNTLKLWDVKSGQCLRTFEGHTDRVFSVSFSPDGKSALSGSIDNTLKLWDVDTGRCLRTFKGHTHVVTSVRFSPDGKSALSGSYDNTLKLWDVDTGRCLRTFEGHTSHVTSVSFSPDGESALSGSGDKTLKLWDVASGQCLHTFEGHTHEVTSVSFSPDGHSAFSGSYDNTPKLWRLDWKYEFPGWAGWDDGAESYLRNFLTVRNGKWKDEDFNWLVNDLQNRGYGWLRPEGVRRQLEKMTAAWQAPPKMPWET